MATQLDQRTLEQLLADGWQTATKMADVRHITAEELFDGDQFAIDSFKNKYAHKLGMYYGPGGKGEGLLGDDEDWERKENPAEAMFRAAHATSAHRAEAAYGNDRDEKVAVRFHCYWNRLSVLGGRVYYGAGTRPAPDGQHKISLVNCTTMPRVEDNLESIWEVARKISKVQSRGEGVGVGLGRLRPKGMGTYNSARTTSGAVHWGGLFDKATELTSQEGRRGALLIDITDNHPEAFTEFVTVKSDLGAIQNANISIKISDKFMAAYESEGRFQQWWEDGQGVTHQFDNIEARPAMRRLSANAQVYAEPGLLFWDTAKRYSNSNFLGKPEFEIEGVNACSEQSLNADGQCTLGHTNCATLPTSSKEAACREMRLRAWWMAETLDDVLETQIREGRSPSPEAHRSATQLRRIGAGYSGFADLLILLGIAYDSEEAIQFAEQLGRAHIEGCYQSSVAMGKKLGSFPALDAGKIQGSAFIQHVLREGVVSVEDLSHMRNVCLGTVAPVGSGAGMLQNYGSGCEPGFGSWMYRRQRTSGEYVWYFVINPFIKRNWTALTGEVWPFTNEQEADPSNEGMIKKWIDDRVDPSLVKPPEAVDPFLKVKLIAAMQRWIDSAISVTFSMVDVSPEEVEEIYYQSWKQGLKGCSVYVYNSKNREPIIQWKRPVTFNFAPKKEAPAILGDASSKGEAVKAFMASLTEPQRARYLASKRPDSMPAKVVKRGGEGKKWYFTLCRDSEGGPLKEFFINTSDENQGHSVKDAIFEAVRAAMAASDVPEALVEAQWKKSAGDRDYIRLSRMMSIALRWGVPVFDLMAAVREAANGGLTAGSLIFHVIHLLEEYAECPTGYRKCGDCGSEDLVFDSGCYSCASCGSSKCG
jgi:ribonucleoside-diphosphate reductase alpha chain